MISIVPATSLYSISDLTSWSSVSNILIAVGLIATLLSSYRYLLVYLFGGMAYWLVVEGIQSVLVTLFPDLFAANIWQSYVIALSLTWLVPGAFLAYRYVTRPTNTESSHSSYDLSYRQLTNRRNINAKPDNYKEHTPIYNNYTPRFHN